MSATENLLSEAEKIVARLMPLNSGDENKTDLRAISSPENGRKGGRKHVPVDKWAQRFVEERYKSGNLYTLRFFAGQWYEFRGDYWHELNRKDLENDLTGFLQVNGYAEKERLSTNLVNDITLNIRSSELCSLRSSHFQNPCFLPSGESATGWLPMKNMVINIEEAARAVGSGAELPASARRDHSPALFATYGLDYDFDLTATCPGWETYLEEVQPEAKNRECLQMMAGLALVPDCRYNVCFFLYGPAGTGKSVFVNILTALVGKDNCCNIPLSRLANRFGLAPLTEKLLNIVGELPQMPESGRSADVEGFLKSITSGDEIPVERKGEDGWKARAIARMVFATNVMPMFTDRSAGVWDRLRIIPFNQIFRGTAKQNPNLSDDLLSELPGIFNWALQGLAKLRTLKTFPECRDGETLKKEHRNGCDHEREFLDEFTEVSTGDYVGTDQLYKWYKEWTRDNGYHSVGAANFKRAVKNIYPKSFETRTDTPKGRINTFQNIRLTREYLYQESPARPASYFP